MRKIIHIDMDCFYAAVETKFHPEYRGRPLGVGGPPNTRSVLCTANYEARKFGVRAAMPSSRAVRLCPHLILVPPHFELYKNESRKVRKILEKFTDRIQPLSLDEAYLDVSDCKDFQGSASLIAFEIRKQIFQELQLTASAGIAPNKLLAKIASDWKKPNGQFTLKPADIEDFMPPLPVEKLFGVGKVTAEKLHLKGFKTCGDLQKLSEIELRRLFGRRALEMYQQCRGEDQREVHTDSIRKSLSVEETYNKDINNFSEIEKELPALFADFERRMNKGDYWPQVRGWVVKMKFSDFKSTTHELTSGERPTIPDFLQLFRQAFDRHSKTVRLLGIGVRLQDHRRSSDRQTDAHSEPTDDSAQLSLPWTLA